MEDNNPDCLSPAVTKRRYHIITVAYPGFAAGRSQIAKYTSSDGVVVLGDLCDDDAESPKKNDGHSKGDVEISSSGLDVCSRKPTKRRLALDRLPTQVRCHVLRCVGEAELRRRGVLYHATCRRAPLLLHNVFPSPEIPEIVTTRCSWNPFHWLTLLKSRLAAWWFGIDGVPTSYMRLASVNLGGRADQRACEAEIRRAVDRLRELDAGREPFDDERGPVMERVLLSTQRRLVLFGCSRGATTTLHTALRLPEDLAREVALVILEAPFDTLQNVINASSWFPRSAMWLVKTLGQYDGDDAYDIPTSTNLACPIAFVTSKQDTRVPEVCTERVMSVLRERLPQLPQEHLQLRFSSHATMPIGNEEDQAAYISFVNRLYDTYVTPSVR